MQRVFWMVAASVSTVKNRAIWICLLLVTAVWEIQPGRAFFSDCDNVSTAYGNQPNDRTHRLTISAIYELPGYNGRLLLPRGVLNGWTVSFISQTESAPPLDTLLTGLDLDGDGFSRRLLPGVTQHTRRDLNAAELRNLVDGYNADIETRTRYAANPDGSVTMIRPRTPFNQVINPITLPEQFSSGDSFISQDLRLTRTVNLGEESALSLMAEVFNVFNIANLSGYDDMLNQVNYGQPGARAGQVFGSGGPRAFQFATRLQF